MKFCIYILYSESSDRYYVGQTNDVEARLERHNKGYVRSTKAYRPWILKYSEEFASRREAMARETEIKPKKSRKNLENV